MTDSVNDIAGVVAVKEIKKNKDLISYTHSSNKHRSQNVPIQDDSYLKQKQK